MLKRIRVPHRGHVCFGRKPSHARGPRLLFKDFLTAVALTPPATTNYRNAPGVDQSLRKMFRNDALGDCVIAARGHRIGLMTGAASGKPFVYTDAQIVAEYGRIGGYVPGDDSTDRGCDMATAANDGVTHGYADGSKDLGWLEIDATNAKEIALAMWLFENLDFGMGLPDAWISPFPSRDGFVWDAVGPGDDQNGHCVAGVDLTTNGIVIDTWGLEGVLTFAAIAAYASSKAGGDCIVHLSPDLLAKAATKAPSGVDWAALVTAFDAIGGKVPVPVPVPPAPPSPAPSPAPSPPAPAPTPAPPAPTGLTLAIAQAAVTSAMSHLPTNLPRATAEKTALNALAKLRW